MGIKAIDPPDCGCTDCLTGYSEPLSEFTSQETLKKLKKGKLIDRAGIKVVTKYTWKWE